MKINRGSRFLALAAGRPDLQRNRTLAFYNIANGAVLKLKIKKRGGVKHRIDAKVLEFGG